MDFSFVLMADKAIVTKKAMDCAQNLTCINIRSEISRSKREHALSTVIINFKSHHCVHSEKSKCEII